MALCYLSLDFALLHVKHNMFRDRGAVYTTQALPKSVDRTPCRRTGFDFDCIYYWQIHKHSSLSRVSIRSCFQRVERAAKKRRERRLAARERFALMHKTERENAASISIQRVRHSRKWKCTAVDTRENTPDVSRRVSEQAICCVSGPIDVPVKLNPANTVQHAWEPSQSDVLLFGREMNLASHR